VTAVEPISALAMGSEDFARLMDDYPPVRHEILNALTQRIRRHGSAISD